MGRPSVTEERRAQILSAFESCVARNGIEGATLEMVAAESGLSRALIRHHAGNRQDLKQALIDRFLTRSGLALEAMLKALPETAKSRALVTILLAKEHDDSTLMLVSEALIAESAQDPDLAIIMRDWLLDFTNAIGAVLQADNPKAPAGLVADVTAGLIGIYFNVESLTPLGDITDLRHNSERAAHLLLDRLEQG